VAAAAAAENPTLRLIRAQTGDFNLGKQERDQIADHHRQFLQGMLWFLNHDITAGI
jgi:16S rRNA U516 pseudouridylate synthase RsuA-like enzyme